MEGLGSKYTKRRLPVELVYCEEFKRIDEAYQRERQIHGWSRKKKIALIEGNYDGLVKYSRKKRE
jgi:putative endonuclease